MILPTLPNVFKSSLVEHLPHLRRSLIEKRNWSKPMKTFSLAWITSSLLLFTTSGISYAQPDNLRFENLSGQRGLPKIEVWKILQDREGFMWFSTLEGLYRFDGHTATLFQRDPNDLAHTLPSNIITTMHEDRKGRLWVATYIGLVQLDKQTGKATMHRPDSTQAIGWDGAKAIVEDQQGILWLGTDNGIARFDPDTKLFGLYPLPNGQSTVMGTLQQDDSGSFWATSPHGLYRFHPPTEKFVLFPILTPEGHPIFNPLSLSIDTTGIAWVGTHGDGLFRMDTRTPGLFVAYNPGGVVHKIISEVYPSANYLLLASNGGLQRINPKTHQVIDYRYGVSTMYKDRLGNLWVGTGNGVSKADLHSSPFAIRKENSILNILEDHTGTVWVGNSKKGLCRFDRTTQLMIPVTVNSADSRNSIEGMQ